MLLFWNRYIVDFGVSLAMTSSYYDKYITSKCSVWIRSTRNHVKAVKYSFSYILTHVHVTTFSFMHVAFLLMKLINSLLNRNVHIEILYISCKKKQPKGLTLNIWNIKWCQLCIFKITLLGKILCWNHLYKKYFRCFYFKKYLYIRTCKHILRSLSRMILNDKSWIL